jgi:hypothetical protein
MLAPEPWRPHEVAFHEVPFQRRISVVTSPVQPTAQAVFADVTATEQEPAAGQARRGPLLTRV